MKKLKMLKNSTLNACGNNIKIPVNNKCKEVSDQIGIYFRKNDVKPELLLHPSKIQRFYG